MKRRCPRCNRTAPADANICLGCGDYLYPNFTPYIVAFVILISCLGFGVFVSQQNGFRSHPRRVALATIGLGPTEDEISATILKQATHKGILKKQRNLFTFDVDEAAWNGLSKPERDELEQALAQKGYGHELRKGEVVKLYAGTSRRIVAVLQGS